jgi:hypothetical protein
MQQAQENIGALGPDLIKQAGALIQNGQVKIPGIQQTPAPDAMIQQSGGMM